VEAVGSVRRGVVLSLRLGSIRAQAVAMAAVEVAALVEVLVVPVVEVVEALAVEVEVAKGGDLCFTNDRPKLAIRPSRRRLLCLYRT
jgi:hypothetical protein